MAAQSRSAVVVRLRLGEAIGPAADWARAGIAFAAQAMMADEAEAVPTYFRKSRRDRKASTIAGNGLCMRLPPLGPISQKLHQIEALGQADNFWLRQYPESSRRRLSGRYSRAKLE